jgi:regulator of nucleoside diphosphate kinase
MRLDMSPEHLIVTRTDLELLGALRPPAELQRELDRAVVVPSEAVPADVVTMNSTVSFSEDASDVRRVATLVFPSDADASAGRISVLSPTGTALLGLSVGQAIRWDFPDGSRRTLRVDELIHQPEHRLSGRAGFRIRSWA